ncbi:CDP-glucose 4,6-dehydratase [Thalassococcus sp. S3]|uniref:CDP-glucose 4,6-dehydratase n=1 Tax=Thalassococcus sp. S3 TaxID=2017482 RepID=UPI001C2BA958|nr:CDP-glucose 4,6-dehydratase [Thalassococcus sp. S3]
MTGFWAGKRVLVTGHTGFKGSWLSLWLRHLGAKVYGLALAPDTQPSLFEQLSLEGDLDHRIGDIRDTTLVAARVAEADPDIVFHLAAQPLVLASYRDPLTTWATNVMGSAHVLEALRPRSKVCAVVMVTTDKVYQNHEWHHPYRETDPLGGHDPYSASKAAMEIAVDSWRKSFLGTESPVRVASARAGNVIGGGDWAANRLLPDIMRALAKGAPIAVRNPGAVRPWQHVLEPLAGYLKLAEHLWNDADPGLQDCFNFGPEARDIRSAEALVNAVLHHWPGTWDDRSDPNAPHEAGLLSLSVEKARAVLNVAPRWDFDRTVKHTVQWYRDVADGAQARDVSLSQIEAFGAP